MKPEPGTRYGFLRVEWFGLLATPYSLNLGTKDVALASLVRRFNRSITPYLDDWHRCSPTTATATLQHILMSMPGYSS